MNDMFFSEYFRKIGTGLNLVDVDDLERVSNIVMDADMRGNKIFVVGNGGSASIANHAAIDFVNAADIRAMSFTDPGLITCFSNDYGYEEWVVEALKHYADHGDVVILISSSGKSENIVNAAQYAKGKDMTVVSMSGFSSNNPLKDEGDINFWIDSCEYNIVEMIHHTWLLAIIDRIINKRKEIQS